MPPLRAYAIASQLSQLTPLSDSYTSPRALSLFSQLEANLSYLETHALPNTRVDITDHDGVVYRWFPNLGFEFHPLANFGALNNDAASENVDSTRTLADALLARAIPHGNRLIWEYQFRFGGGRPPWASGMAQAVAAQALARSSALLADPNLGAAAVRAFASVPPFLLSLPSGPWIRLYGFNGEVVLNAQLQAIVSLLEYGTTTNSASATALAQRLSTTAQELFPRFDTGDWSRYELGGGYAPRDYQKFVTDLLAKLARHTQDPFWIATSQRFHSYYYDPPQVTPAAAGTVADDLAAAARRLSRRRVDPDHAFDARFRVDLDCRQGDDVSPERRHAHAQMEATRRPRARHVPGAALCGELRGQSHDGEALADRRRSWDTTPPRSRRRPSTRYRR